MNWKVGFLSLSANFLAMDAIAADVCYHSIYTDELGEMLDKAEAEYPKWEAGQFVDLSLQVQKAIPCLDEKISPDLAARVHRVMGLRARIVDTDIDKARMAFAASRTLDPKYQFPTDFIAAGDPEHGDFSAIPLALDITTHAPRPQEGSLRFDGKQSLDRPVTFATIFQRLDGKGKIVESKYLWPGETLPAYFTPETGETVVADDPHKVLRYTLGGVSAGLLGAGITLIGNGAWDQGHTCTGDSHSACVLQSRDRVVAGSGLTVLGLAGFAGAGVLLSDSGNPVGFSYAGKW